jgi:hypothetical protein
MYACMYVWYVHKAILIMFSLKGKKGNVTCGMLTPYMYLCKEIGLVDR